MTNVYHFKKPKPVNKLDTNNIVIETYDSLSKAAMANNINVTTLINHLKGRSKTAAGYIWKYKKHI